MAGDPSGATSPVAAKDAWPIGVLAAAALVFVASLATAPIGPLFDPDEGYYPATAAESVDAGAGWDPRFNGSPRWDKPILSYALIEASFAAFGRSVFAARLPSAAQGAALVLIIGLAVARLAGARKGVLAAVVLGSTFGVQMFARVAHPEIAVVLSVGATNVLLVAWLTGRSRAPSWALGALAGASMGYGVLAKGPVAVVLPVLALSATAPLVPPRGMRLAHALRDAALAGVTLAAVALPWYAAMTSRHGTAFLEDAVWRHNVARYTSSESFGHGASPWYFVLPSIVILLPWSALVPGALRRIRLRDRSPEGVLRLFMTAAAATAFLFYSLSRSKLPHYSLVLAPSLAVVVGLYVADLFDEPGAGRRPFLATRWGLAGVAVAMGALPWLVNHAISAREVLGGAPGHDPVLTRLLVAGTWPAAAVMAAGAVFAGVVRLTIRIGALVAVGVLAPLVLVVGLQPVLALAYPWERFGRTIRTADVPVFLHGPRAPSLNFYTARLIDRVDPGALAARVVPHDDCWVIGGAAWLDRVRTLPPFDQFDVAIVDRQGAMALARLTRRHPP